MMQKEKPESDPQLVIESFKLLSKNDPATQNSEFQSIEKVPTKSRTILWHICFWGFIVNYMLRCNLNMAIVSMVIPRTATNNSQSKAAECFNQSSMTMVGNDTDQYLNDVVVKKGFSIERSVMDLFKIDYNESGFDWSEYEQGLCLGSFYWFFWTTNFLGGYLAQRYGTKLVFGLSNFVSCAISSFIPMAAYSNLHLLLFVRMTQGIISGFSWPSMHNLISQWIPPNERSSFIGVYLGGSIALAIFYPLFGYIITIASWEWIFHFSTVSAIIWFILWQYFVYDNPSQDPRIHLSELNYITEALGDSKQRDNKAEIPWKSIFMSLPFWITVVATWGAIWQAFTVLIQLPTYFKFIHGFDDRVSGLVSGVPHLLCMGFCYIFSIFIDYVLRTKKLTRTNARKLAVSINSIIGGIATVCLAYAGCNSTIAIVFTSLSIALLGAQPAGALASYLDLAPNYSSILLGIANTISVLPGILLSYIVGVLTNNNQTSQQWKYVFLISAGMSIGCGVVYIIFGSSEEQSWNKSSKTRITKPLAQTKCNESS